MANWPRFIRQPVRHRDLGRAPDLLAVLCRKQAAARKLIREPVPIEKKLIGWSLGLGLVLFVGLIAANHFVPIAP